MLLVAAALAVDDAEIREHLLEVTATLRVETPDTLAPPVRARRLDALDALESYAWAGDFPDPGSGTPESRRSEPPRSFRPALPGPRVPDFVDAAGTHCAVGYLMALDSPALVASIVESEDRAFVLEMRTPGIAEWAADHGFTADELAWIQPTYGVHTEDCPEDPETQRSWLESAGVEVCGVLVSSRPPLCGPCSALEVHVPVMSAVDAEATFTFSNGTTRTVSLVADAPAFVVAPLDERDVGVLTLGVRVGSCEDIVYSFWDGGQTTLECDGCGCDQGGRGVWLAPAGLVVLGLRRRR
ncbi:MAG: hypothetical protein H6737_22280 [Alphaproteobacteria bacterium]|nr:hypothetical protein [Alphaproteobacteria bacterium]